MKKYQNGDIVLYFEGIIFVYGENATPNIDQAKEQINDDFDLNDWKKVDSKYYRWGYPSIDLIEERGTHQIRQLYESKKGIPGSFPLTDWQ